MKTLWLIIQQKCDTVLTIEVTKAQYLIVSKHLMIQELVWWYLRLKIEPPSSFIYNMLVSSLLSKKKTNKQTTIVVEIIKEEEIWAFVMVKYDMWNFNNTCQILVRLNPQQGLHPIQDVWDNRCTLLQFLWVTLQMHAVNQFKLLSLSDVSLSSLDAMLSSGTHSCMKWCGSTAAMFF